MCEILLSSSRKAFFTHQQSAFPASDYRTFWSDVGMTEFGTLKNGIQFGWIIFINSFKSRLNIPISASNLRLQTIENTNKAVYIICRNFNWIVGS